MQDISAVRAEWEISGTRRRILRNMSAVAGSLSKIVE